MHSPMQRKYAAKAAHGARSEQGKSFPARLAENEMTCEVTEIRLSLSQSRHA